MNDNKTMIEIKDLHKRYGDIEVLHGINLTVAPKEVVVVIGPSGSGKSTMLRCINYLEEHYGTREEFIQTFGKNRL